MSIVMRDPTAEIAAVARPRVKPPASLDGLTVGLLCIGKERSLEFLDRVELRLNERGIATRRYAKPTHTKKAPVELLQRIATECQVVVEGLAD
jgi:hypothetical protein